MTYLTHALLASGVPPSDRYPLAAVARILGCPETYVRYLFHRRKLPVLKIGAQTWGAVRHEDLAAYLDAQNQAAPEPPPLPASQPDDQVLHGA